ncbi:CAP domain-containing protein, partial [Scheffersomyces coipomensis]|uniref:CAP domain-containing protein n=1 Tax=Scheffersomyces coipomensis TaxID=1788519 RepID=UPI00315DDA5A
IYDSQGINVTFAISILDAHNQYRAIHQVAPLSWEVSAYSYAQNDADNYDCSGVLTHTHGPFGENLAAGFPDGPSAVAAWYAEGSTYDYSTESTYNHFTQVVWKGSTKVGCAFKNCQAENWGLYVVCEYDPPGNVIGEEQANVLPPTS